MYVGMEGERFCAYVYAIDIQIARECRKTGPISGGKEVKENQGGGGWEARERKKSERERKERGRERVPGALL